MTITSTAPNQVADTLADLVEQLGSVPLHRILLHPFPGTATEEDVLQALRGPRKRICELVDGVLVEKAIGWEESSLASYLIGILSAFVISQNLGIVTGEAGFYRVSARTMRAPDVSFISWSRLPGRRRPKDKIVPIAPDFAAEVLSEGNTPGEMDRKIEEYFSASLKLLWIVDPVARKVRVYTSATNMMELSESDTLDASPVLPGFTVALRQWFGELDRQG